MRPLKIRVEGFSAYRSAAEIDLEEVAFFSLSGATGSGKSSLVDAMVFALYGRVPRLGGNSVAPAITAGADRARVVFEFAIGAIQYTVARVVERSPKGGASVKEARLQQADSVLASGAEDVTRAVESLLRLRFEDFVRTVVLPQGDFARFLTSPKAERQALLRNLLGLDVYGSVRSLAKTRESVATDRSEVADAQLQGVDVVDDTEVKRSSKRLAALESLSETVVKLEAGLNELNASLADAGEDRARLVDGRDRLRDLAIPDRLEELDHLALAARERLENATERWVEETERVDSLRDSVDDIAPSESLNDMADRHRRLDELTKRLTDLDAIGAAKSYQDLADSHESAKKSLETVDRSLADARVSHAAHALSAQLVAGEPCPVCTQTVSALPDRRAPAELEGLQEERAEALRILEVTAEKMAAASSELTRVQTSRAELGQQVETLRLSLRDVPSPEEIEMLLGRRQKLSDELDKSSEAQATLLDERRTAERELEKFSESIRTVGKNLMAARQRIADHEPPLPESDDVIVQWKELISWRDETLAATEDRLMKVESELEEAASEIDRARDAVVGRLLDAGVEANTPYAVEVARELQVVRGLVAGYEASKKERRRLEQIVRDSDSEAKVAGALAGHLRANGFENWLMAGAIADLVNGANGLLADLSEGGYSLRSDEVGSFSIVDHRNADETRAVSTLSGGETFLVSLALALSLAETLAAAGGAELDTIILDEGFGTLDDESLDTVASVLERLSQEGLIVGVITHVKELASRAPVRFEVSRGPGGSNVRLVS